jgi:tetratricopeptide (TPR) repeat protein
MLFRISTQFRTDATGKRLADAAPPTIEEAARHYAARDFAKAEHVCLAMLAHAQADFDTLHLLGVLCLEQRRYADAVGFLRRAERERPNDPELHYHLGTTFLALSMYDQAEAAFHRTLTAQPDHFDALNNLGNALAGAGRPEHGVRCLRQALTLRPNAPQPLYNLGRIYASLDRPDDAVEAFRAALAQRDGMPPQRLADIGAGLCEALIAQEHYEEALEACRAIPAIAAAPAMEWNESLTLLMLGDFADGWRKYESRFRVSGHDPPRPAATVLDLDDVAGKRVLLFPEQGRGDVIQMARYAPLLAERGARVSLETCDDLIALFSQLDGVEHVVGPLDDPPEHDLTTSLLSLPLAFHTGLATIPGKVPYLHAPPDRLAAWAERLGESTMPRIGLMWRGAQHIPKRSIPVATLEPLLHDSGFEFHALQKEITAADRSWLQRNAAVRCHDADLADFAETAALIAHMDLVISIDTSVAHLAGALGVRVWIMLPFSPDWRWLREREDSPWYPTARLFRQTQRGDWDDVVRRVAEALRPLSLRVATGRRLPTRPG